MFRAEKTPASLRARATRRYAVLAGGALAAAAIASGVAAAATSTRVLDAVRNPTLGENVVVETHGHTLYALRPETVHHLLCKSRACLEAWPPLTVRSSGARLVAGHGVEGRLGLLRRSNGKLQVTLRGLPLYRFSGDSGKDEANGEGIKAFGGTWHAVKAQTKPAAMPPMPVNPPPMTPAPGY